MIVKLRLEVFRFSLNTTATNDVVPEQEAPRNRSWQHSHPQQNNVYCVSVGFATTVDFSAPADISAGRHHPECARQGCNFYSGRLQHMDKHKVSDKST